MVPKAEPFFGVYVVVVEIFPLGWSQLAYDPHTRLASIETPVYEASVGFLSQAQVDLVHDRGAHRTVALLGFGE